MHERENRKDALGKGWHDRESHLHALQPGLELDRGSHQLPLPVPVRASWVYWNCEENAHLFLGT